MDDELQRLRADKVVHQLGQPERVRKDGVLLADAHKVRENLQKWPFQI